ncbi:MAG: argininosuccinate lyase [Bacteroidota bacterium]
MKLWQKDTSPEARIEAFTVGKDRELDLLLAPFDVLGTLAHIEMLTHIGLLEEEELPVLQKALRTIFKKIEAGEFEIQAGVEDVHSQVEFMLTHELGDLGKKVHSGRSRNDQVLLDLKLYFLHEIHALSKLVLALFEQLLTLSDQHKDMLMPGYTHTQVAMPSSFGLWFGAFAESLTDDMLQLQTAFRIANQNPLGSAAGYGSSFPLDREMTTRLLGFETLAYNVIYAQMGRGRTEKTLAFALASLGSTLNKLASDICLYMSQNFGFLTFPDELTTGSSIMPHKKNPDVFELIRAKSNRFQALPNEVGFITTNLITGYHRDLQLIKEIMLPAIEDMKDCVSITTYMLANIQVKEEVLQASIYEYLFSVEAVNREVLSGVPFREAYVKIGRAIEQGEFTADRSVVHTHLGSIGDLAHKAIRQKMSTSTAGIEFEPFLRARKKLLGQQEG